MIRRFLLVVLALLVLGFAFGCGFIVGALVGTVDAYHRQYLEEREAFAPTIAADPAFAGIEIVQRSDGGIQLIGKVPTPEDLERLRDHVIRAIGETRAKEAMQAIHVSR